MVYVDHDVPLIMCPGNTALAGRRHSIPFVDYVGWYCTVLGTNVRLEFAPVAIEVTKSNGVVAWA